MQETSACKCMWKTFKESLISWLSLKIALHWNCAIALMILMPRQSLQILLSVLACSFGREFLDGFTFRPLRAMTQANQAKKKIKTPGGTVAPWTMTISSCGTSLRFPMSALKTLESNKPFKKISMSKRRRLDFWTRMTTRSSLFARHLML